MWLEHLLFRVYYTILYLKDICAFHLFNNIENPGNHGNDFTGKRNGI